MHDGPSKFGLLSAGQTLTRRPAWGAVSGAGRRKPRIFVRVTRTHEATFNICAPAATVQSAIVRRGTCAGIQELRSLRRSRYRRRARHVLDMCIL